MNQPDAQELAAKIRSGAYYEEARQWYSELFHTPIAQRSYYVVVIVLATVNMYFAVMSFMGVFPITVTVPVITYSSNMWEEIPRIQHISASRSEDKNVAVMTYFLKSYVENRESYDLSSFELRFRNIWSESSKDVFEEYKKQMDASNPYGFYRQYTNRSKRVIEILSLDFDNNRTPATAHVVFEAHNISLGDGQEIDRSRWRADFSYKYTDFLVDQSLDTVNPIARFFGLTGGSVKASGEKRKMVPMTFVVSDYKVKELLE